MISVGGLPASRLVVVSPARGAWSVVASIASPVAPVGRVAVSAPGLTMVGDVVPGRGGVYGGRTELRIAPLLGLGNVVSARGYVAATGRQVAIDILAEAAAVLSPLSDPVALALVLSAWTRMRTSAGIALARLVDELEASWHAADDGTCVVASPAWLPVVALYTKIREKPERGAMLLGVESLTLRGGATFEGRRVTCATHTADASGLRTALEFA